MKKRQIEYQEAKIQDQKGEIYDQEGEIYDQEGEIQDQQGEMLDEQGQIKYEQFIDDQQEVDRSQQISKRFKQLERKRKKYIQKIQKQRKKEQRIQKKRRIYLQEVLKQKQKEQQKQRLKQYKQNKRKQNKLRLKKYKYRKRNLSSRSRRDIKLRSDNNKVLDQYSYSQIIQTQECKNLDPHIQKLQIKNITLQKKKQIVKYYRQTSFKQTKRKYDISRGYLYKWANLYGDQFKRDYKQLDKKLIQWIKNKNSQGRLVYKEIVQQQACIFSRNDPEFKLHRFFFDFKKRNKEVLEKNGLHILKRSQAQSIKKNRIID